MHGAAPGAILEHRNGISLSCTNPSPLNYLAFRNKDPASDSRESLYKNPVWLAGHFCTSRSSYTVKNPVF